MSSYLAHRIEQTPKIELLQHDDPPHARRRPPRLGRIVNKRRRKKGPSRRRHIQLHRGVPRTDWLPARSTRMPRVSCGPARSGAVADWKAPASLSSSRPAAPACSRPATCARDRSSASPRRWAKADGGAVRPRVLEGNVTTATFLDPRIGGRHSVQIALNLCQTYTPIG